MPLFFEAYQKIINCKIFLYLTYFMIFPHLPHHKAIYTTFLENVSMARSILLSFSSSSFFLLSPASDLFAIGIRSSIFVISRLVACRSLSVPTRSSSDMRRVPGGILASSSCFLSRSTRSSASCLYLFKLVED